MGKDNFGLVSIITSSYNCSSFIAETIESILSQTYTNWELLITDDCSTDNSREIVKSYANIDHRIKLFVLDNNSGAGVARNNSISNAKGRFIAFCDSDDRWLPSKLEDQLKFMVDNGYFLTYTSYVTCNEDGIINGYVECLPKLTYRKIIRDNGIGCLTAIYDAKKIGKYYMPKIRKRQDWCLWIDIIKSTGAAYGIQKPLSLYRIRKDSISSNKIEMLRYNFNVYNQVEGFNRITSIIILGCYFLPYYIYKKIKQRQDYKKWLKQLQ